MRRWLLTALPHSGRAMLDDAPELSSSAEISAAAACLWLHLGLRLGWHLGLGLRVGSGVGLGAGLDLRGGRLGLREVAAGEDDCRTEPGELGGGAQPDATVGAGHNAHLAAEVGAG